MKFNKNVRPMCVQEDVKFVMKFERVMSKNLKLLSNRILIKLHTVMTRNEPFCLIYLLSVEAYKILVSERKKVKF